MTRNITWIHSLYGEFLPDELKDSEIKNVWPAGQLACAVYFKAWNIMPLLEIAHIIACKTWSEVPLYIYQSVGLSDRRRAQHGAAESPDLLTPHPLQSGSSAEAGQVGNHGGCSASYTQTAGNREGVTA